MQDDVNNICYHSLVQNAVFFVKKGSILKLIFFFLITKGSKCSNFLSNEPLNSSPVFINAQLAARKKK